VRRALTLSKTKTSCAARALACALWLLGAAAVAADASKPVPAQVRAVHRLADLGGNVESFCTTLVETAELTLQTPNHPVASQLDAGQRERWLGAVKRACEPGRAIDRHLRAFAVGYDAAAARAVTAWYTSETGQRLLALEGAAAETDWDAEVSPFVDEITQEPVPVERVKLFERIEAALQTTEDAALLQAGIAEILTYSARTLQPETERAPREEIDRQLALLRSQYAGALRQQQSIVFMFVYREATDEALAAFADFAESDAARWLHTTHRMAMLQLVAETREQIEGELGAS
jgi:hypothetical protein